MCGAASARRSGPDRKPTAGRRYRSIGGAPRDGPAAASPPARAPPPESSPHAVPRRMLTAAAAPAAHGGRGGALRLLVLEVRGGASGLTKIARPGEGESWLTEEGSSRAEGVCGLRYRRTRPQGGHTPLEVAESLKRGGLSSCENSRPNHHRVTRDRRAYKEFWDRTEGGWCLREQSSRR